MPYTKPGALTIRAGITYRCMNPDTGALGLYKGLAQYEAYQRAGFTQRIARRDLPAQAPYYTVGGPDRRCNRADYRAAAYRRIPMDRVRIFPIIPRVNS